MSLFWLKNKTIIIFFIFLTGLTLQSFVDDQPHAPQPVTNNRLPAAVDENLEHATKAVDKESQQKIKVQIFCEPRNLKMQSLKYLVMLELSSCVPLQEKHQLWIKNETNGFKAQIFKIESAKFKTDFIQLNKGTNKLLLEAILKDGQKVVQTLEILTGS